MSAQPSSQPMRQPTYPLAHAFRRKPRRLPLVLRFAKGAVHDLVAMPVAVHSLFTALIVYLDTYITGSISIPATIIPSLSIVVGLMLVFRNSTSYDRFWTGRNCLTTIGTCVRNLARISLVNSHKDGHASDAERADTERTVRILIAILYAIKHNLRAEFNIPPASLAQLPPVQPASYSRIAVSRPVSRRPSYVDRAASMPATPTAGTPLLSQSTATLTGDDAPPTKKDEYVSLLPAGLMGYEDQGLSLPLQLTVLLESYIRRGVDRAWFHGPLASQMSVQVNSLVDAYGRMETIRTTPIPVAHLIHQKQVLALFSCVLPFAIVDDYGWWAIPIVAIVAFTLYGIEGIGMQLEDPFGYDKNDIKMDGIIEDARQEVMVLLDEWKEAREGRALGGMFE